MIARHDTEKSKMYLMYGLSRKCIPLYQNQGPSGFNILPANGVRIARDGDE